MAEIWLTMEKVCTLTGWHPQHARKLASQQRLDTRASESRGGNGKLQREYLLSSLPAEAQAKFADDVRKGLQVVPAAEQTLPLFASVPNSPPASMSSAAVSTADTPRVAIPEELEGQARARLDAIRPLLDFRQRTNGHRPTIRLGDGRSVSNVNDLAEYIAAQQKPPVSSRTLFRWLDKFDTHGYSGLADRPRKDRGRSRFFEEHAIASVFLQQKFLHEGLSREMAWEALCRDWRRIGEKGLTPCYDTARNFLNALPEPLKVLGREGKQAHWSKCTPTIQRGKVPVMDWWISDHREFDVLARNTLFAELPAEKAFRPWLTLIQDWGSRKIVGFCFAPTPSSRTINSALRVAILGHGMPRNFYWDNGEDYKKVRRDLELITLSQEAGALLDRDCISFGVTSALPYHPRSKPIESHFSRWSKRYDVLWGDAYLGNKPGNCPEKARLAQKHHADFLKGKRAESPLPTDVHFIAATIQWIQEFNEVTRLPALDSRTPSEVMEEACPERNRKEVNPRLLDVLFFERDVRTVMAGGCVQLDGRKYEPTDESLFALDVRQGRKVMIARDPYNLQTAIAAEEDTLQFIGELRIQELVGQCPNGRITRDQIKAHMRRERSVRKGYGEWLASLQAMASNTGWQTEREGLLERAGVRTGTDERLALPAAGVPGARLISERSAPQKVSSPFVDDAVRDFLAEESKT
jgi:transposase InsO family protein